MFTYLLTQAQDWWDCSQWLRNKNSVCGGLDVNKANDFSTTPSMGFEGHTYLLYIYCWMNGPQAPRLLYELELQQHFTVINRLVQLQQKQGQFFITLVRRGALPPPLPPIHFQDFMNYSPVMSITSAVLSLLLHPFYHIRQSPKMVFLLISIPQSSWRCDMYHSSAHKFQSKNNFTTSPFHKIGIQTTQALHLTISRAPRLPIGIYLHSDMCHNISRIEALFHFPLLTPVAHSSYV